MMRNGMDLGRGVGRSKHFADEGREHDGRGAVYLAVEGAAGATESCSRRRRVCWG